MRLKKLIISSENNGDIIRDVTFHEQGFSLIVDKDSLQGGSGNNIGKSTFVKLIDICLGAKNVNSIYHDSETDDDELIKSFIEEKKIQVTLFVEDNGKEHSVRIELWKGGKYYIDSEKIRSYSDYCEGIKAFAIPDAGKDISLRSILPFFIRLEWNGQDLFKYLHPSTKYYQYRLCFQYLLGISLNPQPLDLEKSIQEKENENKRILSKNAVCSIDDINQTIKNKNNELSQKVGKLKSDKVVTSFSSDKENARLQTLLDEATQRVSDTEEEISILKAKIKSEENGIGKIDTEALRLLYTDGKLFLKDLMHDFSDLVNFHEGMVKKRIESYQKKVDELTIILNHEKEELNVARREYSNQFIDYKFDLNNKGNNEFDSFVQLKIELESLSKDYNRYLSNVSQVSNWKENLTQYKRNNELFLGKAKELDIIFEQMTLRVLGHQYSLSFPEDLNSFPIICSEGNKSSGEKKAVAACFVFSLLTLYEKEGRDMPMFLVQDQMEGVTASILAKLENEALSCHCQYIIPILSDRAEQITDIDEKAILTLSKKDKLFRI